jgi:hypothetical protein
MYEGLVLLLRCGGLWLNALVAWLLDVSLLWFLEGVGQLRRALLWLLWRICIEKK